MQEQIEEFDPDLFDDEDDWDPEEAAQDEDIRHETVSALYLLGYAEETILEVFECLQIPRVKTQKDLNKVRRRTPEQPDWTYGLSFLALAELATEGTPKSLREDAARLLRTLLEDMLHWPELQAFMAGAIWLGLRLLKIKLEENQTLAIDQIWQSFLITYLEATRKGKISLKAEDEVQSFILEYAETRLQEL